MYIWETKSKKPKGVFVLVHGANEYHVRYEWLVRRLNEEQYHVINGDLPGQGKVDGPKGHIKSFNEYITVIKQWLQQAKSYNVPVILLGHSMGGLASIHTILNTDKNHLPDSIVLSSPCLGLYKKTALPLEFLTKVLNLVLPKLRINSGIAPGSGTRNLKMRKRDKEDPYILKKVSIRWYRELVKAMKTAQGSASDFPDIPLLVLQGGDDRIVQATDVKTWFNKLPLKNKHYKEWEDLYHEVFNEDEKEDVFHFMLKHLEIP